MRSIMPYSSNRQCGMPTGMSDESVDFNRQKLIKSIESEDVASLRQSLSKLDSCNYVISNSSPLHKAIDVNSAVICTVLLDSGKAEVSFKPQSMEAPLFHAVKSGKVAAALVLIEKGADVRTRGTDGTPVIFLVACRDGMSLLLDSILSANPRAMMDLDKHRTSVISAAVKCDQYWAVCKMSTIATTSKITARIPDERGVNPLMVAALKGNSEMFDVLSNFIAFHTEDYSGRCALSYAIIGDRIDFLLNVMSRDAVNSNGNFQHCIGNCVATAVQYNKLNLLTRLLHRIHFNFVWINYVDHSNLLHVLAKYGTPPFAHLILPNIPRYAYDIPDVHNMLPLDIAHKVDNSDMEIMITERMRILTQI